MTAGLAAGEPGISARIPVTQHRGVNRKADKGKGYA